MPEAGLSALNNTGTHRAKRALVGEQNVLTPRCPLVLSRVLPVLRVPAVQRSDASHGRDHQPQNGG